MDYLSANKIAIIDLASGEVAEDELNDDLVAAKIGGAGITLALYEQYKDEDPLVLGAGLLTGTQVPGASCAVLTGVSPLTGQVAHAPLNLYAGMELKYSGFDYLVIKGKAAAPTYLWVHDGIADVEDAASLWGKDVWSATQEVRKTMGDEMIQVLAAGPAAERGSDLAQVMLNFWGSGDRFGFGKKFAEKNLKLIAVRGMGLLELDDAEAMMEQCLALSAVVKAGAWAGKKGLGDLAAGAGEAGLAGWLSPLVHRHRSDFNTPFAANTFLMLDGDPAGRTEPAVAEPGVLITDLAAAVGFMKLGLDVKAAGEIMQECAKQGLDAAAVAQVAAREGLTDPAALKAALATITGPVDGLTSPFSPWAPAAPVFGDFGASGEDWWKRRMAVAYIFGINPVFAVISPEVSEEKLLELANLGTGMEFTAETLDGVVSSLTA